MRISKRVSFQESLGRIEPWYWGIAYLDHISAHFVLYVIPLNYVVWALREMWFKMRMTPKGHDDKLYDLGFKDGLKSTWHRK